MRSPSSGPSPAAGDRGQDGARPAGRASQRGAISATKPARSAGVGERALEHEVPDVLQRALLGELDAPVLAVVVEALVAADVADRGLGDDHALQAARDSIAGLSTGWIRAASSGRGSR